MFSKLKIYNTPAKLLARIKELKAAQEQIEGINKRALSSRLSQGSTYAGSSMKTFSNSPKPKLQFTVKTTPKHFSTVQGIRFKDISQNRKKITIKTDKTIEINDDENLVRKELCSLRPETISDMVSQDKLVIDRFNEEALQLSLKPFNKKNRSPIRKHHQAQSSSVPKEFFNTQDQVVETPQQQPTSDKERGKFFKRYKLANKNLHRIGQEDYRKTIKSTQKLEQYVEYYGQTPNLYITLNKSSNCNYFIKFLSIFFLNKEYNIFQNGLGLLTSTNDIRSVNASGLLRHESKLKVFTDALRTPQCKTLTNLQIGQNNIDVTRMQQIISNLPLNIQELDLSNSSLDSKGAQILAKYLYKSHIKRLNLESNRIGDIGCNHLTNILQEHDYLQTLNLSRNGLTEFCTLELSNYIKKSQNLYELYLHYNNLNPKAAINLWKALHKNQSVKVFDISHNRTGSLECSQWLAKVISRPYPELMHIDISHNGFSEPDAVIIKAALVINQQIYGFHFEGNCSKYTVDSCGHLIDKDEEDLKKRQIIAECRKNPPTNLKLVDEDVVHKQPATLETHRIQQIYRLRRIQGLRPQQNVTPWGADQCWICEGWQEIKFTWIPGKSGTMNADPIFIHFNFENYRPLLMQYFNNEFFLYKMCPPNYRVLYFYTNPVQGVQTTAKNELVVPCPSTESIGKENPEFLYNGEVLIDGNKMNFLNEVYTEGRNVVIDKYIPKVFSKPREEERFYDLIAFKPKKVNQWSLEKSIFKNYQPDNEALIDECFEFDFNNSKIPKFIKENDIDELKEQLREIYPYLFSAYKFYASTLMSAQIPCISMNSFGEFIASTNIIDGKMKTTDVDLNFISTNGKDVTFPNTYEKALVRYQFMEVIVRIAQDKYLRSGICKSIKEAVRRLFEEDMIKTKLLEFDKAQDWRDIRYWNEQCDVLLRDRLPFLKLLFKFTSKINPKTKYYKNIWIQSKDFRDLLNKCELFCDTLVERDGYLAFLLSMMTQVDELNLCRHFQMEFYEFLEALARCAEKLSIVRSSDHLTMEERRNEPLHKKLDALLLMIYFRSADAIKNTFKESEDFSEFDNCMIKKQKSMKQKIEEIGNDEEEEKPYDAAAEEAQLSEQLKQVAVSNTTKKLSFLQVIKFAQQQKALKNTYTLTNIVQYFKTKEQHERELEVE